MYRENVYIDSVCSKLKYYFENKLSSRELKERLGMVICQTCAQSYASRYYQEKEKKKKVIKLYSAVGESFITTILDIL